MRHVEIMLSGKHNINAANYNTVILDNSLFTDSDDTRGCIYCIQLRRRPPEDEQSNARNVEDFNKCIIYK